ncbi:MAG: acyl transferase [Crocinitomicaceae bacterium]
MKYDIFNISGPEDFSKKALKIFDYQAEKCAVYKKYLESLGRSKPTNIEEIPFLPITFFKNHDVVTENIKENTPFFLSSGTGNSERSKHWIFDVEYYLTYCIYAYKSFVGDPENQVIFALLPNYLEQGNSGLVCMVERLIRLTNNELSGFFLKDLDELRKKYEQAKATEKEIVIFGVSYSLLDLAARNENYESATIVETGGMKGRRQELSKSELFNQIKIGTSCKKIISEYGMTELFSQAYAGEDLIFSSPPWMKIITTDVSDPFSIVVGRRGVLNIIDLANIDSCCFIQTQDIGIQLSNGFTIEGRIQHADIRGCNQLVE